MTPHEELSPEAAPRAYLTQPPWKRIVVIAAGPAMNLLVAFVLVWAIVAFHGVATNDVVVQDIEPGSPAAGRRRGTAWEGPASRGARPRASSCPTTRCSRSTA